MSSQPSVDLSPAGFPERLPHDLRMELVYCWKENSILSFTVKASNLVKNEQLGWKSPLAAEIPLPVTKSGDFIMITDLFKVPKLHRNQLLMQ